MCACVRVCVCICNCVSVSVSVSLSVSVSVSVSVAVDFMVAVWAKGALVSLNCWPTLTGIFLFLDAVVVLYFPLFVSLCPLQPPLLALRTVFFLIF